MSLSIAELGSLIEEVSPRIEGAIVRKILPVGSRTLAFELRVPGENLHPCLGLEPGATAFFLAGERPARSPDTPPFVALLKKHLLNAPTGAPVQVGGDRLLEWSFETLEGKRTLVAELSARHGNLFLLDARRTILGSLVPNRSRRRDLVPGQPYVPPARPPEEVREAGERDPLGLASLPADGSRSRAIERRFVDARDARVTLDARNELGRRIRGELRGLRRTEKKVAADLERAERAREYRRVGELLQGAFGRIERGATFAEVTDYYDADQPTVRIELDPRLDLSANVQRYFKLYRKYQGAVEKIAARLDDLRGRIVALEAIDLEELDVAALEELGLDLERRRLLRPGKQAGGGSGRKSGGKPAVPFRSFRSLSGREILVGKGGRHNDALTLKIARGNDLWLHALDWPGAHVVVRLGRGEDLDEDSLLDAATLAAFFSKGVKGRAEAPGATIDIGYTRAKHVRKPRGAPPGRVTYAEGRTISIRVEEERLERLLVSVHGN